MLVNGNEQVSRPLITFALFAFNQEMFVGPAIHAALQQTYNPLEIILSDDDSTDQTFLIMQEIANEYRGPHRVLVRKNETNLGIGAHVNKIMECSSGEYVVAAAGDDISMPERVERVYNTWNDGGRKAKLIYSRAEVIDSKGSFVSFIGCNPDLEYSSVVRAFREMFPSPLGCASAWHRDVFDLFGPLSDNIVTEDRVIAFRAFFIGGYAFIPEALVKYRSHDSNLFNFSKAKRRYKALCAQMIFVEKARRDVFFQYRKEMSNPIITDALRETGLRQSVLDVIERQIKHHDLQLLMLGNKSFDKLIAIGRTLSRPFMPTSFFRYAARFLFPVIYRVLVVRKFSR